MKHREWTLIFDHDNQAGDIRTKGVYAKRDRHDEHVHVIEYSAVEKLVEALEKLASPKHAPVEMFVKDVQFYVLTARQALKEFEEGK